MQDQTILERVISTMPVEEFVAYADISVEELINRIFAEPIQEEQGKLEAIPAQKIKKIKSKSAARSSAPVQEPSSQKKPVPKRKGVSEEKVLKILGEIGNSGLTGICAQLHRSKEQVLGVLKGMIKAGRVRSYSEGDVIIYAPPISF